MRIVGKRRSKRMVGRRTKAGKKIKFIICVTVDPRPVTLDWKCVVKL